VKWIETRILKALSRRFLVTTTLALSAIVLEDVRSMDEDHNFEVAVQLLRSKGLIAVDTDEDGFTTFQLAA